MPFASILPIFIDHILNNYLKIIFHLYCDVLDYCVMQWDLGLDMFLKIL
jgi:hypothetical protein